MENLEWDLTTPPGEPTYADVPPLADADFTKPTVLPAGADGSVQVEYFAPHVSYAMMKRLNTIRHLKDGAAMYLASLPSNEEGWLDDGEPERVTGWMYSELLDALDDLDWD